MKSIKLEMLLEKSRNIIKDCLILRSHEAFFVLQQNLEFSNSFCETEQQKRPLIITLMGGTGVGKSYIFSALCGFADASPSSSSVRGFTKELFVAANEEDRLFLPFSVDEVHFRHGLLPGVVLIDTPDLDTIHDNNARLARKTIAVSDIIICVTTPDKRSDFAISRDVLEWASRKRWFFVMNKLDTVTDVSEEALKDDLTNRLQVLGFNVERSAEFILSARNPESIEFKRLKETVFSPRIISQNSLLKREACVRQFMHAITADHASEKIMKLYQELNSNRELLRERIVTVRRQISSSDTLSGIAADALKSSLHRELASNSSLFLFPYFAILNWLSAEMNAKSVEDAIKRAISSSHALSDCYADERRVLEDNSLCNDVANADGTEYSQTSTTDIYMQIMDRAQKTADSGLFRFYVIAGNLLPLLILFQALYRAFSQWIIGVWLPSDFFIHAIFLITAATLPGYLLVAKATSRISQAFKLLPPAQTPELKKLDAHIAQIEQVLQETSLLNNAADSYLKELHAELPEKTFGISAH